MRTEQFKQLPENVRTAIDEVDTAFATLNIGRDHGITPQAAAVCREAWAMIAEVMGGPQDPEKIKENAFRNCHCK